MFLRKKKLKNTREYGEENYAGETGGGKERKRYRGELKEDWEKNVVEKKLNVAKRNLQDKQGEEKKINRRK